MVGLGILLFVVGIVLWLTVAPVLGWILMAIGVLLVVIGLIVGAVWTLGRAAGRRATY
jgi:hypothetical protein